VREKKKKVPSHPTLHATYTNPFRVGECETQQVWKKWWMQQGANSIYQGNEINKEAEGRHIGGKA
jgi:hypothetical protein